MGAILAISEAGHVAVCLQRGQQDVDEPQGEEEEESDELGCPWASELAARYARTAAVEQHHHAHQGHDGEEGDREGQGARMNLETFASGLPVNGGDGPRHPDAQEHIDRVAACDVPDGRISILVLDCGHFTRKCVWSTKIRQERIGEMAILNWLQFVRL